MHAILHLYTTLASVVYSPLATMRSIAGVTIPPLIGVGKYYTVSIAGQLVMSVIFGFCGVFSQKEENWLQIGGIVVATCGSFLISYQK